MLECLKHPTSVDRATARLESSADSGDRAIGATASIPHGRFNLISLSSNLQLQFHFGLHGRRSRTSSHNYLQQSTREVVRQSFGRSVDLGIGTFSRRQKHATKSQSPCKRTLDFRVQPRSGMFSPDWRTAQSDPVVHCRGFRYQSFQTAAAIIRRVGVMAQKREPRNHGAIPATHEWLNAVECKGSHRCKPSLYGSTRAL